MNFLNLAMKLLIYLQKGRQTYYRQIIIDMFGKLSRKVNDSTAPVRQLCLILSLPCMHCLSWTADPIICLVFCICWPKGRDGSCQNRCQPHGSAPVAPGCWSAASRPACWNLSDAARPFGTSDPAGRPVTAATRKGHWILWLCPARDSSIAKTPQHRKTNLYCCSLKGIQLGPGSTHCLDVLIATNLGCWSIIKRKGCLKIEDWQDPQNPLCLETPWSNSWFWIFDYRTHLLRKGNCGESRLKNRKGLPSAGGPLNILFRGPRWRHPRCWIRIHGSAMVCSWSELGNMTLWLNISHWMICFRSRSIHAQILVHQGGTKTSCQ